MHAIAQRAFAWHVGALQFAGGFEARINGQFVAPRTNFTFQVNMSAHDLARLLAKIALGWAVARHGLASFEETLRTRPHRRDAL